jgi:basic membrane lipoprotein Med (substrate-binding protein (PBP1-ABC) superfamily)
MKPHSFAGSAAAALCALTLACGGEKAGVALLTPGPVSDRGWNAAAFEGLQRIHAELKVPVAHVQVKTPSEFEEQFRDFAARGAWLEFGHGFEFQDAAARVARDFPKTVFVTTSGSTLRPNMAPMVFELEQATYLCGIAAARLSKSGIVGAVGGVQIPSVASTFLAFEGGVHSVDPRATVRTVYTGSFDDAAAARQATLALADQGCDVVIHNADAAGAGVFQAARERKIFAFGTNKDQNGLAPEIIVASAVIDIPQAFVRVAQEVRAGKFRPRSIRFGFRDGVISYVWNPKLAPALPGGLAAEIDRARAAIEAGTIVVPRGNF